jgi:hypothetical protein
MNNPDHISESLETIFWVKVLKFFDADPLSGMEKIRIRDKHPESATLTFTSVVDPRSAWIRIDFWLSWIRIRIGNAGPGRDPGAWK